MKRISLAIFLMISACSQSSDNKSKKTSLDDSSLKGPSIRTEQFLSLQSFPSCASADAYLRENMRRILKDRFDRDRDYLIRYPYGNPIAESGDSDTASTNESASEKGTDSESSAPTDYSQTNTQEVGVDEPDMMKNNGTHIFTLSGNTVQIVQSWPANAMKKVGSIKVEGAALNLFLTEDKKLVIASHPRATSSSGSSKSNVPWYEYGNYDYNVTRIDIYDVNNPSVPSLSKTYHFRGNYLDMRRQGNILRLVSSSAWNIFPEGVIDYIDSWNSSGKPIDISTWDRRRAEADRENEAIIQSLSFAKWMSGLGNYYGSAQWTGTSNDLLDKSNIDCTKVYASEALGEFGLTAVTSLDLATGNIGQSALLAPSNMIYASDESLYVAHNFRNWWWGWGSSEGSKTYLHKFSFNDSTSISYQGSGVVDGYLNNQFSLDEENGYLRVAVTDDHVLDGASDVSENIRFTTTNRVLVLKAHDKSLAIVGQTPDLAKGERIYSVRFHGNKGYVVTFRQVDPLFTLDLSDPKDPKVVGELKVSGYSSYIHMIDSDNLLTVGQEADPNTGRSLGLKISVFDVSNPAAPVEKHKLVLNENEYAWSDAEYDHHAFTYFASRGLLGIPVGGYRSTNSSNWWDEYFSELRVFKIDLANGISSKGAISMNDLYRAKRVEWDYWWGGSQVRRSVFADDFVYAISETGVRAVNVNDMASPIASVGFYP